MLKTPLVSVVIPFYSNKNWLIEALESCLNQSYSNSEILVINDGSPEDISEIENKYRDLVIFISKKNGGPSSARNLGIKRSKGKYIAFLDSDDIWLKNKLELQISHMENTKAMWSHHSYEMFWDDTNKSKIVDTSILKGCVLKDLFISFKAQTSCIVVRREMLDENNIKFPIDKRYGQDLAFFKQIAQLYPIDYVDGILSKFRVRGTNAGFRAKVQLSDKASVRNEIKKDKEIIELLPINIKIAYELSYYNYKLLNIFTIGKNPEILSKLFYILPYVLFKMNLKKR